MNYGLYKPPIFSSKKEKRKTLLVSLLGFVLGVLGVYGIALLNTGGNLLLAILAYICGLVAFISFWVFIASLFEK